ncbi:MAG: hypothetical protein ABI873_05060, partial [Marmoricola sp.]
MRLRAATNGAGSVAGPTLVNSSPARAIAVEPPTASAIDRAALFSPCSFEDDSASTSELIRGYCSPIPAPLTVNACRVPAEAARN